MLLFLRQAILKRTWNFEVGQEVPCIEYPTQEGKIVIFVCLCNVMVLLCDSIVLPCGGIISTMQ